MAAATHILMAERWRLPDLSALERPLVAISAPVGYGKSTLLTQWQADLEEERRRVVSLVVDPDDREGDRLLADLLNAFSPGETKRSLLLRGGVGPRGRRAIMTALVTEMATAVQPCALFIDDVHWLSAEAAQALLRMLIAHQPTNLLLVLSSRTLGALQISDALLDGRARLYTSGDLAFGEDEIDQILRQYGMEPRPDQVKSVLLRTEGWPAAVRLIAMTIGNDEQDQDSFLEGLTARDQPLTAYLGSLLLAQLPPDTSEFLLGVAILRRFSVPLAQATTGAADAVAQIEELERRALPLTRTGYRELPYALHPLVREFLLAQIKREFPDKLAIYAARARDWLDEHQMIGEAIDLSLDIEDVERAAELIDRFAQSAARQLGHHATFLYWCNKIPSEQLSKFPRIQVIRVWTLGALRRYGEASQILDDLEAARKAAAPDHEIPNDVLEVLELERSVQLALRDRWVDISTMVEAWRKKWPDAQGLHEGMALTMLGLGRTAHSDFGSALTYLGRGYEKMSSCGAHYTALWGLMWTIVALAKQGEYRRALFECDEGISCATQKLGSHTPVEIMFQAQRAFLLYEFDRLDEAAAALDRSLTVLIDQSSVDSLIMGYVALARLQNARGEHLDATELLAEGEILGWSQDLPRLAIALGAERIELLLRQDEHEQADALWKELNTAVQKRVPEDYRIILEDKRKRIETRLALAVGDPGAASALAASDLDRIARTGQKRKRAEMLMLQARALEQLDDSAAAAAKMQQAVNIAMPQGYVRMFIDEGPAIRSLLEKCRKTGGMSGARPLSGDYLESLTDRLDRERGLKPQLELQKLSDLTQTETRIAGLLDSTLANRQLADVLLITESTLKWHLKNIYSKLGVSGRLAAIAEMRKILDKSSGKN